MFATQCVRAPSHESARFPEHIPKRSGTRRTPAAVAPPKPLSVGAGGLRRGLLPRKEGGPFGHSPASRIEPLEGIETLLRNASRGAEGLPELLCLDRHEGRYQNGEPRQLAYQGRQDLLQLGARLRLFGE